jgi:hypothetical protein
VEETDDPCYRPRSLVPSGDWRPVDGADRSTVMDPYESGKCLRENLALIRVINSAVLSEWEVKGVKAVAGVNRGQQEKESVDPTLTEATPLGKTGAANRQNGRPKFWRIAAERLDGICRRLCADTPLEHKGCWLATGGGVSMSTTRERSDGKLTGLHIDRWERQTLSSLCCARNRVCLNMGPSARWLVFIAIDVSEIAARSSISPTLSFTTSDAQTYLRQN